MKFERERERERENVSVWMGGCFEGKAVFITAIYLLRSPLAPESSQSSIGRASGMAFHPDASVGIDHLATLKVMRQPRQGFVL